jgi:hypothetical protein
LAGAKLAHMPIMMCLPKHQTPFGTNGCKESTVATPDFWAPIAHFFLAPHENCCLVAGDPKSRANRSTSTPVMLLECLAQPGLPAGIKRVKQASLSRQNIPTQSHQQCPRNIPR